MVDAVPLVEAVMSVPFAARRPVHAALAALAGALALAALPAR
jgi:hypothetical protein